MENRWAGSFVGMAFGDAVGTTLEFQPKGTFEPITDMVGGGPFNLKVGEWTDDTSMALCLARSLIKKETFDPKDQMDRYIDWRDNGYMSSNGHCFDIGMTVSDSLKKYQITGKPFAGSREKDSSGNGCIMRICPIAIFYNQDIELASQFGSMSSCTTHSSQLCRDASWYFVRLLVLALRGKSKEDILNHVPHGLGWEVDRVAAGSFRNGGDGSGYVVDSLKSALWAFYKSEDFMHGCLLAANLGNDADTTAAIYGQLAGAYYGYENIPKPERLAKHSLLYETAMRLGHLSKKIDIKKQWTLHNRLIGELFRSCYTCQDTE